MSLDPAARSRRTAGRRMLAKAVLDRIVAGTLLVVTAGWLLLVAIAVRLDTPGPVLRRSRRLGRDGRSFELLGFRCTVLTAPPGDGPGPARVEVPTRVGRVLQPLGLDLLPQLLNVLRGELSLVGPPPQQPPAGGTGAAPLPVRPGLIAPRSRPGTAAGCMDAEEYLRTWSIGLDLVILGRALRSGFTPGDAR